MTTSTMVEAQFESNGQVKVYALTWRGQHHRVTDQGRQWTEAGCWHGLVMISGNRVLELSFNPGTFAWTIVREPAAPPSGVA